MPETKIKTKTSPLPLISILATGGTIAGKATQPGSVANYRSGAVQADDLLAAVPGLDAIARIRCRQVASIGSEDMEPKVWLELARALGEEMADPDVRGVVILHGTDTMEETACFLDLCELPENDPDCAGAKPVVMTGAMRPADALSADGPANMLGAVRVALSPDAACRGVLVFFNDAIHLARRVYKEDSLNVAAFASSGGGPEGALVDGRVRFHAPVNLSPAQCSVSLSGVTTLPRVEIIYGHAGQRRELVDAALAAGAWGLVHAGVGMGNIHAAVRPALAEAAASGVAVVCSSRLPGAMCVHTEQNRRDRFITAGFLNPQKARVVLKMALLRTGESSADVPALQRLFDSYQ